jgi:drug/metabolite transporter (DMT)-like permease
MMKQRTRAEFYLFLCTFLWGGTFVVVKGGLEDASPMVFIAVRFAIAMVLFLPLIWSSRRAVNPRSLLNGAVLGTLLAIGFIVQTVGLEYTTASKSGFLTGLLVIFTPIFQVLIERRAPRPGNIVGILLVLAGLYLLTSPAGSSFNTGDFLTLICAAIFGLYIVYLDIASNVSDTRVLTWMQFVVTLVITGAGAFMFEQRRFNLTADLLLALLYLSVLATALTLALQTRYQKETTPTRAALIFSLEPVLAAVFAYFFRHEHIGALGVLGGGLIVGGLLVSELSDRIFKSAKAGAAGEGQG